VAVPGHRPPGGSPDPKTYVTWTVSVDSQIGHCSPEGLPTFRAARSSSGWASHTSTNPSLPFRTSRTTAFRIRRYSTRACVIDASGLPEVPGREVAATS